MKSVLSDPELSTPVYAQSNSFLISSLRQALYQSDLQNQELRSKLQKIHAESDLNDLPSARETKVRMK